MSFSDTPVLRPISNKRKPATEELQNIAQDEHQDDSNSNNNLYSESDVPAETYYHNETPKRQQYQGKQNNFNGNRPFLNQQYYRFFQYTRNDNTKQYQGNISGNPNSRNRMMHQKDFYKNNSFNNCGFQKFPNKPRNNYPAVKSLNPRTFPKGYKNFITLNSGNNNTFSSDFTTEDCGNFVPTNNKTNVKNASKNVPKNDPKKKTQKLKILRHTPVPASAKISPKKIIEKIAKFNKASLKNIINNPSKYDEVLQKFGREQALEDQKNEPQTQKAIAKSDDEDKGTFEIVPDDTVEVSAEFFDFLQMDNNAEQKVSMKLTEVTEEKPEELLNKMESNNAEAQPKLDLMSRLIVAENIKTNHAKKQGKNTEAKSKKCGTRWQRERDKDNGIDIIKKSENEKCNAIETIDVDLLNDNETDLKQQIYELSDDSISCEDVQIVENVESKENLSKNSTQQSLKNESQNLEKIEQNCEKMSTPAAEQTGESSDKTLEPHTITCNSPKAGNSKQTENIKIEAISPKAKSVATNNNAGELKKNQSSPKNEKKTPNSLLSLARKRVSRIDSLQSSTKKSNGSTKNKNSTLRSTSRRTNSASSSSSSSSTSSRSGSSSSSSSSTSSSSTSRSSSSSSSTSHIKVDTQKLQPEVRKRILLKRRRHMLSQKLNIQYIVDTFEARILPNLAEHLLERYREKYSKSLDTKLLFICRICTNNQHKECLQNDLKSTDKKKAIIILMREVKNVMNKQPEVDDMQHKEASRINDKLVNNLVEENADCSSKTVDIAKNVEQSVDAGTAPTTNVDDVVFAEETNLNLNSNTIEEEKKEQIITVSNLQPSNDKNDDSTSVVIKTDVLNEPAPLIPFMKANQFLTAQQPTQSPAAFSNFASFANMSNIPNNFLPINMQQQQQVISDPWISNIHDIDCRISDLVKRKQFINEMIAKLQRDSMELDMQIVGLQKEKFMLLNAAMTANANTKSAAPPKRNNSSKGSTTKARNPPKSRKCIKRNSCISQSPNETPKSKNARLGRPQKNRISRIIAIEETQQSDKENAEARNAIPTEPAPPIDAFDYSNISTGELTGIESPVNQLCIYKDCIIGATEDGHLYRFNMTTLEMIEQCRKHDTTITQLNFCTKNLMVYTTSLDGYFKATSLNDLQTETQKVHLDDQIQSLDIQWDNAFIGARSGNIYTCNTVVTPLTASILHAGDSSIMAIKATKEGPRKILIISSKGNAILFRDAINGLLLRTINVTDNLCIYGFLFDDAHLYCGTQRQQVLKFDFTTGAHISTFYCGNGVVAIRLYKSKYLIVACYDGYIYILNKLTGDKVEMLPASGRLPLTLEIFGNKLLTSSKDKTMKIIDIPSSIVNG